MKACPSCGTEAADDARFCSACGATLAEPPRAEERKLVTVLFADVTGYTGLGEKLDAERLKEIMDAYFVAMREAIEAEGGTVEKFIGDAVMAVFGAPVAHEDDPARALRAALGMRKRLEALNETLRRSHDVTLEMRVGVNSGEVMAIADPSRGMGLVTGDPVSVAARLEQNAEPGEVLVAERVARATRGFMFAEVGPLALKGKGQAVRALRLVGEQRAATERGIPGLRAPLVGRGSEMELLASLFKRVADEKRPHLATVYGDAGVGKSRLTSEFLQGIESGTQAPLIVSGRCLPYGEGVTYWPLAEILKGLAGVLDTDPPDLVVEKIRKLGRELLTPDVTAEPARATAALAYTVGVEDPAVAFRDLSPRQVRVETHSAWRSLFSGLALDRPVVALIEDIHWADTALLDLLEELADRMQGPVLLICPARPELTERRPTWGGGRRNFSSIFLDPLSLDEAGRLIEFLLSVEDLPRDVNERILERAEGNPFFLEEIVRHLIDEGMIVHDEGRWKGTAECGEVVIPDTVQGVLAARIDLLSPQEKRVAQSAAVVGRIFWTGPLRRLVGEEVGDIDEVLDALESRELIRARLSSSIGGDREYIFKHVLTRDVSYESLPKRDRATAHATVAVWLEETAGERRREFAELLAYHFAEAVKGATRLDAADAEPLRGKAVRYLLLASDVAKDRYVIDRSQRYAEEALALASDGIERAEALELLGLAYQYNYRGQDAWRTLCQAVDEVVAAAPDDHRRIAEFCAWALETPLRYPGSMTRVTSEQEVLKYLHIGMAAASHLGDDSPELIRILIVKSFWPYAFPPENDEEYSIAKADGLRAADMARRIGNIRLESAALDGAGSAPMMQGLYREADEIHRRRLRLTSELGDPWEVGDIHAMVAWVDFMMGRFRDAAAANDERIAVTTSDAPGVAVHVLSWTVLARFRLGEWDEALADLRRIEDLLGERRSTPPYFASRSFAAAALIHEVQGNSAGADVIISTLRGLEHEHDEKDLVAWSPWIAPLLIRRGDSERAMAIAEHAAGVKRWAGLHSVYYEGVCEALPAAGRWQEIPERARDLRAYAERGGFEALPPAVDVMEGRLAVHLGDLERAVELFRSAVDGFSRLEAGWDVALTKVKLGEALIALERREEAREPLSQAHETFDRLGAVRERAKARELLG
jgi:class 3 adenylate cyclase/tetratricopeptide (TPR) repeat protein